MSKRKYRSQALKHCLFGLCVLSVSVTAVDHANAAGNEGRAILTLGIGRAQATVKPNTDDAFYDGHGLSLGIAVGYERRLVSALSFTGRIDFFGSVEFSSALTDADASYGMLASVGAIIGQTDIPGRIYLSASIGPGFASLSDQGLDEDGDSICIFCRGGEGGASAGISGRLAVGITMQSGRFELAWIRAGGNGNNEVYNNDEEAYLDAIMLQWVLDDKSSSNASQPIGR